MVISIFYFIKKKPTRGFTGLRDFPVGAGVKNHPANARRKRGIHMTPESGIYRGGGNSNPLQDSCLENPTDRRTWRATVYGVAKSQTQLATHIYTMV